MEEKILERLIFDFYGELLSERQKTILDYYYNDDFSLAEISEIVGVTRQGVYDAIKRANHSMKEYEDKLGLLTRHLRNQELLKNITDEIRKLSENPAIKEKPRILEEILSLKQSVDEIINGF